MGHFSPRRSVFGKAPYRMVISVSSSCDMSEVGKVQDRNQHAEKRYMKGTKKIKENSHGRILNMFCGNTCLIENL